MSFLSASTGIHLKGQGLTSSSIDSSLNIGRAKQSVGVRHTGESTSLGLVLSITEVVVAGNSISIIGGVERLVRALKHVRLNKDLSTVASVDTIVDIKEVAVVDVASTETDGRGAGVDVVPVVVGIGDSQVSGVFITVVVGVSDEGGLPVVVQEGVGHGNVVGSVGELVKMVAIVSQAAISKVLLSSGVWETHINQAIVVVFVVVHVGGNIAVVNPHVGRVLCRMIHVIITVIWEKRIESLTHGHRWHRHCQQGPS